MKSERFRTELITNVSHGIKTPLTSIINYVDLLSKEQLENETVREYIEVLERQSSRLKKLIEDLMDASKASTGSLRVDMERFVRGDSSRSAEGSGLGLSIAESLMKLMGGSMELLVDGDLFKVKLTFYKNITDRI